MLGMKQWMISICFLLLASFGVHAQTDKNIVYDANAQVRKVVGFTAIEVSGAIDLYISQGTEDAVAVSASSDEVLDRIRTEVKDNVLKIYFDGKGINWRNWTNNKMKAYVTASSLRRVEASGACNVRLTNRLTVGELMLEMSGASDFSGEVAINHLKVELSGACGVKISGTAANASISASGASSIKAYELKVDYCKLDASGASDIKISVNKELNARASGGSSINYKGEGLIRDISSSGASSVKKREE